MSRKSERLVNLTIALLHSKRALTKSEIFESVAGYEGSPEAMERMFERDKEQLRSVGVPIETKVLDNYFEDEIGYRIDSKQYSIDLGVLDPIDVTLMANALHLLEGENRELLVRIRSLHSDDQIHIENTPNVVQTSALRDLFLAIEDRRVITFEYLNSENEAETRRVAPYFLYSLHGDWYVLGNDAVRQDIRNFKLSRFASNIEVDKKENFDRPEEIDYREYIETRQKNVAKLLLRKGEALGLRAEALEIEEGDDWDIANIEYFDEEWIIQEILWHLESVVVSSPLELREKCIASLKRVVAAHE